MEQYEIEIIGGEDYPKILETAGHISVNIYLDEPGFTTQWLNVAFEDLQWISDSSTPSSVGGNVEWCSDEWRSVHRWNECSVSNSC